MKDGTKLQMYVFYSSHKEISKNSSRLSPIRRHSVGYTGALKSPIKEGINWRIV